MKIERKITKFSVGKFTNGLYVVRGVMVDGVLSGVITKTYYPDLYEKGTYVEVLEYLNENDKIPHFIKVLTNFRNLVNFIKCDSSMYKIKNIIYFLNEIYDLPNCCWDYKKVIQKNNREVIFEKHNTKSILLNYVNLTPELELELINIIYNKYKSRKILNEFYVALEKKHFNNDIFDKNCTVNIESYHNKKIFLVLKANNMLDFLYQTIIDNLSSKNENLKILNEKNE